MDFGLPDDLVEMRDRVAAFIRDEVIPYEADPRQEFHGPTEDLRHELVAKARAAGLLSPHGPVEFGGLGLNHVGMAVVFEAAGYSTLGPLALNIQAPDEGNTNILSQVATQEQKERWLAPLVAGEVRSVFAMTEPDGGAGSDPSLMRTEARPDGDDYIINGRKWLITGMPGASFQILMARTFDAGGTDMGATMFMVDNDTPGIEIVRVLNTIDSNSPGGHAEVSYTDVRIPARQILGEAGKGFRYAQVRLTPARMTHCMRWLGAAVRANDIAVAYAKQRHAFGKILGEHEGVGFMLADNETDLHLCRLAIWHACWLLDQGEQARDETSMSKVRCSEALSAVVDRSLQILGGRGITDDTVVERIYRDIRAFRIYDGPSEVHRWALARSIMKRN
ncbi:MAG: acyl-CoA dehydrogenase [Rhodospirillaceae bacterium]|nr:acyl-CoA dehydrogenase [Rhodospirillaceae bacterium]MBT5193634.1 acyl-CoA dehydrogenase [Rhodospirillaceae bacterium]MBT5895122.1 acyl-CoA dehydrogenase [Rhodospirillaceae bacterium]MBT6427626.1 acyl-CoA dehydrogenase [Rhodospirillaceae bacterium]MBT7757033.1 acyl-CoA dehydrogenase [Rhodospirillaceae bacterium]